MVAVFAKFNYYEKIRMIKKILYYEKKCLKKSTVNDIAHAICTFVRSYQVRLVKMEIESKPLGEMEGSEDIRSTSYRALCCPAHDRIHHYARAQ